MEKVQLQLFKYNEAEIPELTEISDYNAIDLSNNLTFIAGIYGMNFENMPELKWRYGYFFIWGVMLTIFIGMIFYFKKKKWL